MSILSVLTRVPSHYFLIVKANNPTAPVQSINSLVYTAINAFIAGLGLFYPGWNISEETCLSVSYLFALPFLFLCNFFTHIFPIINITFSIRMETNQSI